MKRNYITMTSEMDQRLSQEIEAGSTSHNFMWADWRTKPAAWNPRSMTYLCYAPEICPTTGRPHWQSYMHLKKAKTPAQALKIIKAEPKTLKLIITNGTHADNRIYCKGPYDDGKGKVKPENPDFVEFGELPQQGARNDVKSMTADILDGMDDIDLIRKHGDKAMRMYHGIDWVRRTMKLVKRTWPMEVRIYWSDATGVGKSRIAWDEFGIDNVYEKPNGKWWDGYMGQHCVIIDDIDPENMYDTTFAYYLKLMDRYPMKVEWKHGMGEFCSKVIIFTSNFNPDLWWPHRKNRAAFFRRVTMIKECTDAGDPGPPNPPEPGFRCSAAFGVGGSSPPPPILKEPPEHHDAQI